MILYGRDFPDRKVVNRREKGDLFESDELTKIWGLGHVWIGNVTTQSCAYTARYIMKKVTGEKAKEHYLTIVTATGEMIDRVPEFIRMSRRPGIAKDWIDAFQTDVFPSDTVVVAGKESQPPKYYDRQLEKISPAKLEKIKRRRTRRAAKRKADNTPERLATRETVKKAAISILKRDQI